MSNKTFYFLVLSFCFGILLRELFNFGWSFLFLIIIFSLFVFLDKKYFLLSLFLLFIIFGYLRMHISLLNIEDYFLEKEVFIGTIVDEVDQREDVSHYIFKPDNLGTKIRITIGHYPVLNYGDKIEITGKFEQPKNFENENGIEFDYRNFLLKDDIQFISYFPKVTLVEEHKGNFFKEKLFELKYWFVNNLERSLPSPHSALAAGILVGSKQALGKDLLEDFRRVGLIHIVVLSGYNVTIIIDAIQKFFSFLPRTLGFYFSLFSIISFAIFTGASATTVRASIMAGLVVLSRFNRRDYDVNRALFLAGFFMVLHNPRILFSDPGFQLSFMATLGLLHISPKISSLLDKVYGSSKLSEIKEIISTTISTQIAVLPLLIVMTGEVSIVSLLANVLVLPIIPLSMAISTISGMTNWLGVVSVIFSIPNYFLLEYSLVVTRLLSDLFFAVIKISLI